MKYFAKDRWCDLASLGVLLAVVVAVFVLAPRHGEFWWSEAPRNALNGAFLLDFVRELPLDGPRIWAVDYYLQYPALTILFYPPLFHIALAAYFAVFGLSHATAVACVSTFLFLLLAGVFALMRRFARPEAALAAALLLAAAPAVILWGQRVMLEIPAMALATWGTYFLLRYGDRDRGRDLVLSAAAFVAAAYTKQTLAFLGLGAAVGLMLWKGPRVLARKEMWVVAALSVLALLPLVYLQVRFGAFNITSLVDRPDVDVPDPLSWAGLTWYAAHLPEMLGFPFVLLLAAVAGLVLWRPRSFLVRGDLLVHASSLVIAYLLFSLIDLKETRHGLPLVVPLVLIAGIAIDRITRFPSSIAVVPAAGVAVFAWQMLQAPVPHVGGYREAAEEIGRVAPANSRVMFAGNRDGSFIFNVRALDGRGDITIVRADKLFLDVNIMPQLGLNPRDFALEDVASMLNRFGIAYVVTVPRMWEEAPVMADLADLLQSEAFEEISRIPVTGRAGEKELVIYRNRATLVGPYEDFRGMMRIGGRSISP